MSEGTTRKQRMIDQRKIVVVNVTIPIIAIIVAMLIGAILIAIADINPWRAYGYMLKGAFGSSYGFGEFLTRFVPLLFCGDGFSIAFKNGFFNVGAEGQLYMGALGAALVGIYIPGLPPIVHIPLAILAGFVFGMLWCSVAGTIKVSTGASELINTMMLNYIAILLIGILVKTVLKDPTGMLDQTQKIVESARLPLLFGRMRLHLGFFLALITVYIYYFIMWRTKYGFLLRSIGKNPHAAQNAGMDIVGGTALAFMLSGGFAGVGGAMELMGNQYRLMEGFSPGYGFDAIGAAVMGRLHPIGILLASLLFAFLRVGAGAMQRGIGVPLPLLMVIQGIIIVTVVSSSYITRRLSSVVIGGRA